jgi:hypothetical protein
LKKLNISTGDAIEAILIIAFFVWLIMGTDLTEIVFGGKIPAQEIRINPVSKEQTAEIIRRYKEQSQR